MCFRSLSSKYGVSGIPALVVVKDDGTVITKDARSDVQSKSPKQAFTAWKGKA